MPEVWWEPCAAVTSAGELAASARRPGVLETWWAQRLYVWALQTAVGTWLRKLGCVKQPDTCWNFGKGSCMICEGGKGVERVKNQTRQIIHMVSQWERTECNSSLIMTHSPVVYSSWESVWSHGLQRTPLYTVLEDKWGNSQRKKKHKLLILAYFFLVYIWKFLFILNLVAPGSCANKPGKFCLWTKRPC